MTAQQVRIPLRNAQFSLNLYSAKLRPFELLVIFVDH